MAETIVKGYRDVVKGLKDCEKEERREVRKVLRGTGDAVKAEAAGRFARYDEKTARRFRTVVRQRGISVEQSLKKSGATERRRPNFGELQLDRALEPAAAHQAPATERRMEQALDEISVRFNRGGVL